MDLQKRRLLLLFFVSASMSGTALAEPQLELRVRLHSSAEDLQVIIRTPKLGSLVAERDSVRKIFVATVGMPDDGPCVVPLDVAAASSAREDLLHLQFVRPRLTSPVETWFAAESPAAATEKNLMSWETELRAAVADEGFPDEQAVLDAYFRGRRAFRYWHGVNPAHSNTIRAVRLWFDAAYQLAKISDRPYRMDRAAIRAVRELGEEARGDPQFEQAYQNLFRVGYSEQIEREADALVFRNVGAIAALSKSRRFSEALALNTCMLELFRSLPPEKQQSVTTTQRFTEELLTRNEEYLRQAVESPERPAG